VRPIRRGIHVFHGVKSEALQALCGVVLDPHVLASGFTAYDGERTLEYKAVEA